VLPGYPRHADNTVAINPTARFLDVPADAWQWQVGAHQVCRKWLLDRRGRVLTPDELRQFPAIVHAALATQVCQAELARLVENMQAFQ
jgi:hypothetical protein